MATFIIGLCILAIGGALYGWVCERIMGPDDRTTPALAKTDGVDFVPMRTWKNSLINLLNIAGTGPILGPIQGILFGPIAFIIIPVGCVLGGAIHDYFSGMLSLRNGGAQMPALVKKFTNGPTHNLYLLFICILMPLVGAVFVYTPGDIAAKQVLGLSGSPLAISTWVIYGAIFVYYAIATLFPIDKISGRIYPIFGLLLLLSTVGVFAGLFMGGNRLDNLSFSNWDGIHPLGEKLIPIFFITVACGIVSGFHSTQTSIIARSVTHERQGRMTFFNMMILEGFIAMVWAAAAMAIMNKGIANENATDMVGIISRDMLGPVGGLMAIFGAIVLPITSGDTALRGLRLMVAEKFNIDQKPKTARMNVSLPIFAVVAAILVWAKFSPRGFTILWRYFAWCNQTIAIFAFAIIAIYLLGRGHRWASLMALIPGSWYAFVTFSFICNASIGLNIPMPISYALGALFALGYAAVVYRHGCRFRDQGLG
jgi:carbon starvation protein CstA